MVDRRASLISAGHWTSPRTRAEAAWVAEEQRRACTFATYAQGWLADRHDLRPTTRASYGASLNRHLIAYSGSMPVDEISTTDVRAWFNSSNANTPTAGRTHTRCWPRSWPRLRTKTWSCARLAESVLDDLAAKGRDVNARMLNTERVGKRCEPSL